MRRTFSVVMVISFLVLGHGASLTSQAAEPPPGAIKNVEYLGNVPDAVGATALNFANYEERGLDVMFAVGTFGLRAYDLTGDPTSPRLLDSVGNDQLALPGDVAGTYWQNEDMDVDARRKLVFLARDPRAFNGTTSTGTSGVYIIDARDPSNLDLITFHELPAGHTSTCINGCRFLWTGGPAKAATQPADWGGRPIFVTDIRDPRRPFTYPEPVDLGRNDGTTDYSHDVQVDANGIAWVSGRGGIRGYWTSGRHRDPLLGRSRVATAWNPIPYAGGGIEESAAPSKFFHNSERPVGVEADQGAGPSSGFDEGELVYGTEERFSADCGTDGAFVISSLEGSFNGEGWRSTPDNPFRLRTVGAWSVADKEGSSTTTTDCSAHYFQLQDGVAAYSWYSQGTRFIDVTDPRNPIQVAYFRPDDARSWAPYYHGGLVYIADHTRGIDIIRLTAGASTAAATNSEVLAPTPTSASATSDLRADPLYGWACPIPAGDAAAGRLRS